MQFGAYRIGHLNGPWSALSNVVFDAYEIHQGQTRPYEAMLNAQVQLQQCVHQLAWANGAGNVLACYFHGLFESPVVLQALFGAQVVGLEEVFETMALQVATWFNTRENAF